MVWGKLLRCIVLLGLPMMTWGAAIPDPRKPLRYPFGLTPNTTAQYVQEILTSKGLKRVAENGIGDTAFSTWQLSGQISYGDFKPQFAILTWDKNKLSSVTFVADALPTCGAAENVYQSAMAFIRENYIIDKRTVITREPSADTLDCGPHYKDDDYELQLTSKEYVLSSAIVLKKGRYTVSVKYRWAGLLNSIKDKNELDSKDRHAVSENL